MSQTARKLATYDDLRALGEDARAEVIAGEIAVSPSPLPAHSKTQRSLGSLVGGPYDDDDGRGGPGGWWIFMEVDVRLSPHDIVRPDLVGYRRERLPNPARLRPIEVVPDWVCEVVSPTSASRDRVHKRSLYARAGVPHYWLVDPEARLLEALSLREGAWVEIGVYDDNAKACIPPFEGVELEIGRLFLPKQASE